MGRKPKEWVDPPLSPEIQVSFDRNSELKEKKVQQVLVLKKIFEEDIVAYAKFVFPHHCNKEIPDFHRKLYSLYMDFSKKKVAIAAPRGRLTGGRDTNTSDAWPLNLLNSVDLLKRTIPSEAPLLGNV